MKLKVPRHAQGTLDCGPTALAMVFAYFGEIIDKEVIKSSIGGLRDFGSRTIDLAEYARREGFTIYCYTTNKELSEGKAEERIINLDDTIAFLNKRLPVILAIRSHYLYPDVDKELGHFIVIIGYKEDLFYYNDPEDGKEHNITRELLLKAVDTNAKDSSAYLLTVEKQH